MRDSYNEEPHLATPGSDTIGDVSALPKFLAQQNINTLHWTTYVYSLMN